MGLPGVVVKIGGEAKQALTSIDKVGDALGKLPGEASKAAQGVGRHASDLASHVRKSGDDVEETGHKSKRAFDEMGDSSLGAASAIGEAFGSGGSVASSLGSAGEVVESFAGMFGPGGIIVSAIGGVALGAVGTFFGKTSEKLNQLKEEAKGVYQAMIDGAGRLSEAYKLERLQDFIGENAELVKVLKRVTGSEGLGQLKEALSGDRVAYDTLRATIETHIAKIEDEIGGYEELIKSRQGLNEEQRKAYSTRKDELAQLEDLRGLLKDSKKTVDLASDSMGLLADATGAAASAQHSLNTNLSRYTDIGISPAQARILELQARYYRNAPTRQAGGQVMGGESYWVGESGPEMFTPSTSGYVSPAGSGSSSGPITVHMHLHAAVATPTVVREAAPVVTRAIVDAQRRSGTRIPAQVYTDMGR